MEHTSVQPTLIAYATPVPPRRPTSVLVLAIIGIVLASLGLLGFVFAASIMVFVMRGDISMDGSRTWHIAQMLVWLGFNGALMWICVAAIRLRPWARVAWARWAKAYILWTLVDFVVTVVGISVYVDVNAPVWQRSLPYLIAAVTVLLACVYPVFVLVYMRKRHVCAAFEVDPADAAPVPLAAAAEVFPAPALPERSSP